MLIALIVACTKPDPEPTEAQSKTFAHEWGSANRSEGVLITERPEGGWYVAIEIAAPARVDPRLVAVDDTGAILWEQQWGKTADDEVDVIVPLSDGLVAAGGRQLLNPTADSDSVAIVTLIDPAGPEVVEDMFYLWNGSNEDDRVAGIAELDDGSLALVGEAGPQLLFAEVDPEGERVFEERSGPEIVDVAGAVSLGGGTFVLYGTAVDGKDFNDEGQLWAAEVNRGGNVVRQATFGELYRVRDEGTDLVILDDEAWLITGETGEDAGTDMRLAVIEPAGDLRYDLTWDSGGSDRDPHLTIAPDGTVWGAVVRNRDELIPMTIDPATGDVSRLDGLVGVDRVLDLWVDDERICVALALPGDVKGGYLASFACGAFDGGEIVWPELRSGGA